MHREIQMKQFPIVTTHWWPKTRNERFVWENEQYLYRFFTSCTQPCPSELSAHTSGVWRVCARALARRRQCLTEGVSEAWCWRAVIVTTTNHILLWCCMNWIGYLHEAIWLADASVGAWKVASAPRFRHTIRQALTPMSQSARTHTSHTGCVCTQITWTWLCTRGKKRYKYCSFSHTNRSFRVLGHQCVVTMGNCLIWISLCMFFFPLIETVTYTCHYMTDRLERFDLKTSKLDLLKKKRHLHLGCPWGKLIDTKF